MQMKYKKYKKYKIELKEEEKEILEAIVKNRQ